MSVSAGSSSSSPSSAFPSLAAPSVSHLEPDEEDEEVFDGDDLYLGDVDDDTERNLEMYLTIDTKQLLLRLLFALFRLLRLTVC